MSPICLDCALKGMRDNCASCKTLSPRPRFAVVSDIIGKVAKEHRIEMARRAADFAKDFKLDQEDREAARLISEKSAARKREARRLIRLAHRARCRVKGCKACEVSKK